ncbi:MAG TPA: FAD-binding oxidoreductase [Kofleriaceae bacterium]|nr:FAD-binding oxidoreductase [Kofleriaceae bacterium]
MLTRREDFTDELTTFHVSYDEPLDQAAAAFVPGQYVAIGLNNTEKPELGSVRRSMSLASAPEQREAFEFYVRYVKHPESENPLTHLLWKMKVGDKIFMTRKPVGVFTVEHTVGADDPRWRIYVAAGTGLAPFVSMVRSAHLRDERVDLSKTVLLHGASYPADLCYKEELERYASKNGLHYLRTVSRPKEAAGWSGDVGRVEDYFKPDRLEDLERRIGVEPGTLRPSTAAVLICGLQGTIAETIIRLTPRGFIPENRRIRKALDIADDVPPTMWWEQYDNTPVIDINDPAVVGQLKDQLAAAR